ncbi:MAG: FHA domain-containing protein [Deltaproteobacteria bacterium]|nr:FHA domain-containing protein [Deltaproteobacteria bacterium]
MNAQPHKTVNDYIAVAKSMTAEAFGARYQHPFLFGREVLEEEFRFSTLVTEEPTAERARPTQAGEEPSDAQKPGADTFRIRHWVISVKKPAAAPAQDRIFLGRSETNDICVPHKTVSKLHAYFVRDPQSPLKWFVVDTGSANGTKHNGLRIPPRAKVPIVDGDTICFGRCVFQWTTAKSLYERVLAAANGAG